MIIIVILILLLFLLLLIIYVIHCSFQCHYDEQIFNGEVRKIKKLISQ